MEIKHRYITSAIIVVFAALCISTIADNAFAKVNYSISRPKLAFEVSYEFDHEKRTGPFINRDEDTSTYSERLDIATDGWIYHPALVEFTLTLSPEWEQIHETFGDGKKQKTRTFLEGYDAEFIFLQYKPYTITLFGNRTSTTVNSNLARKSKVETDNYGIQIDLKYSILPTVITYTHNETNQTGFFASSDESDEVRVNMKYDRHLGDTRIDMSYLDATETTRFANTGTNAKNISVQNINKALGNNKTLTSFAEYRDRQSNIFIERGINWREDLLWEHAKNLTTNYNLRLESMDLHENRRRQFQAFNFELRHLLYENLTTIVRLDTSENQNESGHQSDYGGGLDWNYVRRIPSGRININVSHGYRVIDRKPNLIAGSVNEPQEPVKLDDLDLSFLKNINVITNTIRVFRDSGGGIKGAEFPATDYEIVTIGRSTGIKRTISSNINDEETVLVDYSFVSDSPFDFALYDRSYGVSLYLWESLDLYYRITRSNQKFLRGIEPETLRSYVNNTLGAELKWKFSTTAFEYINIDSTDLPTESWRFSETLIFRPTKKMYLSLNAGFGRQRFKEIESSSDSDRFQNYRASAQVLLSPRSNLSIQGFLSKTSGIINRTRDRGLKVLFEWVYNIYTAEILYDFLDEKDKSSNESFKNHLFMVTIKRRLF